MALTTIRKVASFVVLAMAICALIASWVVFERPYGTIGTIAASLAPFIAPFVVLFVIFVAAAKRKPLSPNYPRIEHLRIAGKYQAVGRFGEMGISPLHLRR
ncbi:MAG TPA: hypothetical protein VEJ46_16840 [Candidatus Acidoferrum sp.]|nr:hypothetical protein [Candidatus Acidoferrum sp.]